MFFGLCSVQYIEVEERRKMEKHVIGKVDKGEVAQPQTCAQLA